MARAAGATLGTGLPGADIPTERDQRPAVAGEPGGRGRDGRDGWRGGAEQWVLLGNLQGTSGAGHVGLSEVQVYGRKEVSTLTYAGSLAELNTWVNATVYRGSADFNGTDTLTVNVNDQGHTDGAALDAIGGGLVPGTGTLVGDTVVNGTNVDGTGSPVPEGGEQGNRDEDYLFDGSGLSQDVNGKWVLSNTDVQQNWSVVQDEAGLMLDLGGVYTLDALQVWNLNAAGQGTSGAKTFEVWVSSTGAGLPTSTAGMTQVKDRTTGNPLTLTLARRRRRIGYKGQTYRFNGAARAG